MGFSGEAQFTKGLITGAAFAFALLQNRVVIPDERSDYGIHTSDSLIDRIVIYRYFNNLKGVAVYPFCGYARAFCLSFFKRS